MRRLLGLFISSRYSKSLTTLLHPERQELKRIVTEFRDFPLSLSLELPLHYVYQEEEAPADLLCNQEKNSGLHQKDPDHLQMKEEQEELCTSLDQEDPESPQMKIKEEQEELCTSLDQEDPEPAQMKEEQEELCTSLEGELLIQNQQSDTFIATSTSKKRDHSDTEPDSYQLLCQNVFVAERSDQERSKDADLEPTTNAKLKPMKTHHRNNSHSNNVDNTPMAESHCETDTGKKTLTCEFCGTAFKNRYSLKKHYSSHTDEKLFACKSCEKSFSYRAQLKVHMRTHTGEKPYSCKTCGKSFSHGGHLKVHMRTHTGEKPYSCKTCGKSFNKESNLKVHMRIHTGEKPYTCKTCGKSFNKDSNLKVHMRLHTAYRPLVKVTKPVRKQAATNNNTTDLQEYTETVTAYITNSIDDVTDTKTITVQDNQKPWLTEKVYRLMKTLDAAFRGGNKLGLRTARANLSCGIRAKRQYSRRIAHCFSDRRDTQILPQFCFGPAIPCPGSVSALLAVVLAPAQSQMTQNSVLQGIGSPPAHSSDRRWRSPPLTLALGAPLCYSSNLFLKFADDTIVVRHISDETNDRSEVSHLAMWCRDNNLSLNVDKMKEIVLDFRRVHTQHTALTIGGAAVESVSNTKFLGVHIAEDLS
ncbi:zinc finger and SCAN domain-containing protein 31-like [Stegastes partitus]|uniref:Zinc finger and SCAN domain-containing protein 31-like n=1 Tax=Stegastes partitus TaxID=144197 RepID=A0A9Y4NRT6_9TELE|nr:PREDICTED: zinc finger and SCAN domain-containing protein 31-like [Stegastes partitus]